MENDDSDYEQERIQAIPPLSDVLQNIENIASRLVISLLSYQGVAKQV